MQYSLVAATLFASALAAPGYGQGWDTTCTDEQSWTAPPAAPTQAAPKSMGPGPVQPPAGGWSHPAPPASWSSDCESSSAAPVWTSSAAPAPPAYTWTSSAAPVWTSSAAPAPPMYSSWSSSAAPVYTSAAPAPAPPAPAPPAPAPPAPMMSSAAPVMPPAPAAPYPTGSPAAPVYQPTGTGVIAPAKTSIVPYTGAGNTVNAAGLLAGVGAIVALFL